MIENNGTVAHYTRVENLEEILGKKTIKLSPVEDFADPRESSLDWIDVTEIGHGSGLRKMEEACKLKKNAGSQINVLCTCNSKEKIIGSCPIESSIYGRPRMWSQYGDNSKGFCIVFNKERLNDQIKLFAQEPEHLMFGNVEYYEWLHRVGGGATIEYGNGIDQPGNNIFKTLNNNRMLYSIYFKKSIDWEDECEFRWLIFSNNCESIFVSIEDCVEAVVLGCKFPTEYYKEAYEYCKGLNCSIYILQYVHPKYQIQKCE